MVFGGNTFLCHKSVRSSQGPLHTLHFHLHPLKRKYLFAFLLYPFKELYFQPSAAFGEKLFPVMMRRGKSIFWSLRWLTRLDPPQEGRQKNWPWQGNQLGFGEDKNNRYYSRAENTMEQMATVAELFHHSFPLHPSIFQI